MNKFLSFLKKFWIDIVVVSSLLVLTGVTFTVVYFPKSSESLIANVYLKKEKIKTINLTELGEESQIYTVNIDEDEHVHIEAKHNSIRVKESTCPHQYCVRSGWISEEGRSIICVPYELIISIEGYSPYDVEM